MTLSKELQPWFRADIVFKDINTPSVTKTMQFTNRTAIGGGTTYFPLLISESGIGQSIGQDGMPDAPSGTITLDDTSGNFGEHRSISDLFERFTIINQEVTLFWAQTGLENTNIPSSWTQYWKGKVTSWDKTCYGDEQLSISVSTVSPEIKYLHKIITEDMAASGYRVPGDSLAKTLPVIFNDGSGSNILSLPAYSLDSSIDNKTIARFAYALSFGTQFVQDGASQVYAKQYDGEFRAVVPSSVYNDDSLQTVRDGAAGLPTNHGKTEFLNIFPTGLAIGIVTGCRWWCQGQNNGAIGPTGEIRFIFYRRNTTMQDGTTVSATWQEVTSVVVKKFTYLTEVRGAAKFFVDAVFPEAIPIGETEADRRAGINTPLYALGIVLSEYTGSIVTDFTSAIVDVKLNDNNYFTRISDAGGWLENTGAYVPRVVIDMANWSVSANTTDSEGFNYRTVNFTQENRISAKSDMQNLDIMVSVTAGINDDAAGVITGTPNIPIFNPVHILRLVTRQWSGSSWVPNTNDYDTGPYATEQQAYTIGDNQRRVAGYVAGSPTLEDFISILVKETASFLVPRNNGKLSLLPWSPRLAVQKLFTDENCSVLTFRQLDISAVVNATTITYAKNSIKNDESFFIRPVSDNVGNVLVVQQANPNSSIIYGTRPIEDRDTQLIADLTTATTYANYILARSDAPAFVVRIEVPFFDNSTLEIMHIVDLVSTKMPAHYGSNYGSQGVTFQGNIIDIFKGRKAVRAQRYRCQIIGKQIDRDRGVSPRLILDLRVVKPFHASDPTCDDRNLLGT